MTDFLHVREGLTDNQMNREANEVYELCTYVDSLEKKLDVMSVELSGIRQELKAVRENTIPNHIREQMHIVSSHLKEQCKFMKDEINEIKERITTKASEINAAFRKKGRDALFKIAEVTHLKSNLISLRNRVNSATGKYYYPDNIDDANTFTYEYNSDGSVLETVTRDNEVKYTNQYTFDSKFLTSQKVIFPNSQSTIYTNFKYYSDYVAFDEGVDRRYWEEACDVSGKLNGMTLEFDGDMTEFGSSYTTVKLDYYFEDSLDSFGNINMRIQKYDIEGGELGGRNLV